jgi:iron(III) transport system ATP-binding protein
MSGLQLVKVSKLYQGGASAALNEVNVKAEPGEFLVLLGPSGSGKTTLLRCLAGLIQPTTGKISIAGRTVADVEQRINVPTYRRHLAMVFQNFALWPHMTVRENVAYPLRAQGLKNDLRSGRVEEMLALVHCAELGNRLPGTLSGGQQQRIALARALVARPELVLFDEPLSNLDALLRVELRGQLRELHRLTGFTGVYVTHDQTEALNLGTRIAVMNQGDIVQVGTPEEVYSQPATEYVSDFMGMANRVEMQRDGDRLTSKAGGRLIGGIIDAASVGRLVVRFRPDHARVLPGNGGSAPTSGLLIPACEVQDRSFLGEEIEYTLRFDDQTLKARVPHTAPLIAVGAKASLTVDVSALSLFEGGRRVRMKNVVGSEARKA